MKTYYRNDLNKAYLVIEGTRQEEGYEIPMLRENVIPGLLRTDVRYMNGMRQFHYEISAKVSLVQNYERENLGYEEIKALIEALLQTIHTLKNYMMDAKGILLDPEFIFCEKGMYYFCYYPEQEMTLAEAFHKLTEYMVREVDYRDEKGVHLAYVMHKATMEENYSIEQIMDEFLEERKELTEVTYKRCEEELDETAPMVAEKGSVWTPLKKFLKNHIL